MKLRSVFVDDRKQVHVPAGWRIYHSVSVNPPKGKPQFQVLLIQDEGRRPLGFSS